MAGFVNTALRATSGPVAIAAFASTTTGVCFVVVALVLEAGGYSEHGAVRAFALDWSVALHLLGTLLASVAVPSLWCRLAERKALARAEHQVVFLESRGYRDEPELLRRVSNGATLARIRGNAFERGVAWGVAIGSSVVPIGIHRLALTFHASTRPHHWELQVYFAAAWLIVSIHLARAVKRADDA